MGAKKLIFPIALAILWVVMTAMAMVDFASFDATTRPSRISMEKPRPRTSLKAQGKSASPERG
jgi:hypothetical protein